MDMMKPQPIKQAIKQAMQIVPLALLLCATAPLAGYDLADEQVAQFIDEMVAEGLERGQVRSVLADARRQQSVLDAISRPAERTMTWDRYQRIFLQPGRINGGVAFWRANRDVLERAERERGVPAEVLVAIIGVETFYGRIMGNYRVLDALATLAFSYPPRSEFFRGELGHFLHLAREQGRDPRLLKGSYAGAMGLGQFIPSTYRAYALDYDGDNFADIWNNRADAIWSVANYLARHGWRRGRPIVRPLPPFDETLADPELRHVRTLAEVADALGIRHSARHGDEKVSLFQLQGSQGTEHWMGYANFYVITRYNRSRLYAMAVRQLAAEVRRRYEDG